MNSAAKSGVSARRSSTPSSSHRKSPERSRCAMAKQPATCRSIFAATRMLRGQSSRAEPCEWRRGRSSRRFPLGRAGDYNSPSGWPTRRNPLTPRVAVNRIWQKLFGEGLVRSVDYFGTRGETPSHPELLDHLATRFMHSGWSQKQLIRSLVLSRTYRLEQCQSRSCDAGRPRQSPAVAHEPSANRCRSACEMGCSQSAAN
jgi:hypothetical protein